MEGSPVFLSYPTLLRLLCCFNYLWLRSRNSEPSWRRPKLRPTIPGYVLHRIIRSLPSPSVYSFSHIGSSTLALPKHRAMHWLSHTRLRLRPWYSEAVHSRILVSLTNRIYSFSASPLILGRLAPSSLASPTNRVNHRISETRLSPSIPGPQWHVRAGDSALPRWSEKNQPWSQEM